MKYTKAIECNFSPTLPTFAAVIRGFSVKRFVQLSGRSVLTSLKSTLYLGRILYILYLSRDKAQDYAIVSTVCVCVCIEHNSKSCERIWIEFSQSKDIGPETVFSTLANRQRVQGLILYPLCMLLRLT